MVAIVVSANAVYQLQEVGRGSPKGRGKKMLVIEASSLFDTNTLDVSTYGLTSIDSVVATSRTDGTTAGPGTISASSSGTTITFEVWNSANPNAAITASHTGSIVVIGS